YRAAPRCQDVKQNGLAAVPRARPWRQILNQWRLRSDHGFEGGLRAFLVHVGPANADGAEELIFRDDRQTALVGKFAVEKAGAEFTGPALRHIVHDDVSGGAGDEGGLRLQDGRGRVELALTVHAF